MPDRLTSFRKVWDGSQPLFEKLMERVVTVGVLRLRSAQVALPLALPVVGVASPLATVRVLFEVDLI